MTENFTGPTREIDVGVPDSVSSPTSITDGTKTLISYSPCGIPQSLGDDGHRDQDDPVVLDGFQSRPGGPAADGHGPIGNDQLYLRCLGQRAHDEGSGWF